MILAYQFHFRWVLGKEPLVSKWVARATRRTNTGGTPVPPRVSVVRPNLIAIGIPERLPATRPDFLRHGHGLWIVDATIAGFLKKFPGDRVAQGNQIILG